MHWSGKDRYVRLVEGDAAKADPRRYLEVLSQVLMSSCGGGGYWNKEHT